MFDSEKPNFFVSGGDDHFSDRQKNVFAKLDAAVKDNESFVNPNYNDSNLALQNLCRSSDSKNSRHKLNTKQFRGKESIFKRPEAPPPARIKRDIPDHKRNPHKWTKYTLSDVSPEDMSDQSNTNAALTFLEEIKSRKAMNETDDIDVGLPIVFQNPSKSINNYLNESKKYVCTDNPNHSDCLSYSNSKLIMPEYVIGQKKNHSKKLKRNPESNGPIKEVKLDHLTEEEIE